MESHQNWSSFSSFQQLLKELENLVTLESERNGNPWVSVTKISTLFYEKYGVSLEAVAKNYGYCHGLKSLFKINRRFLIYGTSVPQQFYVMLSQKDVSGCCQAQASSTQYRIKRSWKVDGSLLRMLRTEGAEELPSRPRQKFSGYQPTLVPEIKSINDMEIALIEISKGLIANHPRKITTLTLLSKKFFDYYGKPIKTVMRTVCPDMKLIDLLQTIPGLCVQEVNGIWQITLAI